MADISAYLRTIREAEKGEAVRDAIIGALNDMNLIGGNASTLDGHPASYFATASLFNALIGQVGEVDDVLVAIENGLNALKYDMGNYTLSGEGGTFTVDCTGIKGYDNLDTSKFYFELTGAGGSKPSGSWTPAQSYDSSTGIFTYTWGTMSADVYVKLWVVKPTKTAIGTAVTELYVNGNGRYDAGEHAAYNPVIVNVPNPIATETLRQEFTRNGHFIINPRSGYTFNEAIIDVNVDRDVKTLITQTFSQNGVYRAIDDRADGYKAVTVNVNPKILIENKRITSNGRYRAIDDGGDGYVDVQVNVPPDADLGHKSIGTNGTYNAEDDNLDGFSSVTVNVPEQVLGAKTITANGTYDPLDEDPKLDGFNSVTVNVPQTSAVLGALIVSQNGTYRASQDNYDGYNIVTVNVESSGGGEFDPDDYTTYIESDTNSWIDIGYKVKNNSRFEIVADVNSNNSQYAVLCGVRARSQDTNTNGFFVFTRYNGNSRCSITFGSSLTDITPSGVNMASYFYDHKSMYTIKKNTAVIDNGDEKIANIILNQQYTVTEDYSVYIFSLNQSGSEYGSVTRCLAKLYAFSIYEGDDLVMDLVPFLDGSTPCLKDKITGNMYYNSGSGTLTYGEDN